jgi:HTH-type transcriptional regulator / antitoxin HipB
MQVRTDSDLGIVIRDRRKQLGLDQGTLASRVGVSRQWIVEVEKGKPRAEVGLILRVLRVLGMELCARVAGAWSPEAVSPSGIIDIDAVIDRARADRGES